MKKRILIILLCAVLLLASVLTVILLRREKPLISRANAANMGVLLTDLVNAYDDPTEENLQAIEADLTTIRSVNRKDFEMASAIAENWQRVFLDPDYRLYFYEGDPTAPELAGAGIPEGSGHAIVVLGFELRDGEMQPELIGRCEAAAAAARALPDAILVCSGGATGENNPGGKTEAGLIRKYLVENCGIDANRIFTDEKAMTTAENAVNSFRIMQEQGIHTMTIVTSAYHMRWGQAVYHVMAEIYRREHKYDIRSVANYCYDTEPDREAYQHGERIAVMQIAGILELPEDVIRSLPSFFPAKPPADAEGQAGT